MKYAIQPRGDHLLAVLSERESGSQMREFLMAAHAACREHQCPKLLISVRDSRPVFKPEDYGIATYVNDLVTDRCQIALVGDTSELNAAHEYIEVCARQHDMNVRAFADQAAALRWLRGAADPARRYRFARIVLQGAPEEPGVYALWDGEELVYYGRGSSVRSSLLGHLERTRATHYSWEVCSDPASRETQLLREFERAHGRLPRENKKAS